MYLLPPSLLSLKKWAWLLKSHILNTPDQDAVQCGTRWVPRGWPGGLGQRSHRQRLPPGASLGLPDLLELSLVEPGVAEAVLLLLAEDLQL